MITRTSFTTTVQSLLKDIPREEHIKSLEKMKSWIDSLITQKKSTRTYCPKCKKYVLTKKYKSIDKYKIVNEPINVTDGINTIGKVKYLVHYRVCPFCGHLEEEYRIYCKVINSK